MAVKRVTINLPFECEEIVKIIEDQHGENDLSTSAAINLVIQLAGIIARTPLALTTGELLYCCDILNGGASLTEFKTPDAVSIKQALDSMMWSLEDGLVEPERWVGEELVAAQGESEYVSKWGLEEPWLFLKRLRLMDTAERFALAMATRQFWSGKPFGDIKPLKECSGYHEWAAQWIMKEDGCEDQR